jgi:hypothetical protein
MTSVRPSAVTFMTLSPIKAVASLMTAFWNP